jgi:hypothetical protein
MVSIVTQRRGSFHHPRHLVVAGVMIGAEGLAWKARPIFSAGQLAIKATTQTASEQTSTMVSRRMAWKIRF